MERQALFAEVPRYFGEEEDPPRLATERGVLAGFEG